jgi:rhombotail lipoprotein
MERFIIINYKSLPVIILCILTLAGCSGQKTRFKSSVVDYLYHTKAETVIKPSTPTLNLPLKVGIAFVPKQTTTHHGTNQWSLNKSSGAALTSAIKSNLLEKIATHFIGLKFVSDIEVIPTEYLTPNGGFSNLEQIQTMYGIDVIALVSYDQVQFTDEGFLSLTYWTLIGAYVVSGEKNDTSTMLDTVVYDIKSKKMLFRAPGTSIVKGSATPVNLSEELRIDSLQGFKLAAEEMTKNLTLQLNKFQKKIKKNPGHIKIVHSESYSGGGSFGLFEIITLALLVNIKILIRLSNMNKT